MNDIFSINVLEDNKEFSKIPDEKNETLDQSISNEELKNFNIHEIFTNLDYPSCPEKLEKINLENLLNIDIDIDKKSMDMNSSNIDENLDYNFNIITSHSFNTYSVSSSLNKIKFLKSIKEENSKLENTYLVNTPSSDNVQNSDILITEDLDSLIKGVQSMPVIPKLQQIVPIINKQPIKKDENHMNKKKKRNKRKRKSERERERHSNEYNDDDGEKSPKSRKINSSNKNWDDITIEESQYFDVEDKENSFESILNQYNSMKQLPKDILVISQILNEPNNETKNNDINKPLEIPVIKENKSISTESNKENISLINSSPSVSDNKILNINSMNEKEELTLSNGTENIELNKEKTSIPKLKDNRNLESNINEAINENSMKFKESIKTDNIRINEDLSDIWNKNSPISSTSSNASSSNMSDEEINYNTPINHKKHKLEHIKYNSILTPPTPPQPLDEN